MEFPDFFAAAPAITLRDPLAAFLGTSKDGVLHYGYADAVKLAGHSCPTVAGAYLMLRRGLRFLYGDAMPERGGVEVHMRGARDQGTTGVTASVATLLTGAAPETGFAGIGSGRIFSRRDLLRFDASLDAVLGLRRCDSRRGVQLDLDLAVVPPQPEMQQLFPFVLAGRADHAQQDRFRVLWQARVAEMLTTHADDPALVQVREWPAAA